jgi:hypothetical protein
MLKGLGKLLDEAWKKKCKGLKGGPGREIKAFILSFADRNPDQGQIGSALLAAAAHDPRLLQPSREETCRHLSKMLPSGMSFECAAVIFFAVQGHTLMELLSLSPLSVKECKDLAG